MESIAVELKAKNSSGEQKLHLMEDKGEFSFTLTGEYEGEKIQIDFDVLTLSEIEDIHSMIELIKQTN